MRKILSLIIALALTLACAAGIAESAADVAATLDGIWYINQIVENGVAYDVTQLPSQSIIEFKADSTGWFYTKEDEDNKTAIAWTVDDKNNVWFTDEATQETRPLNIMAMSNNETYLMIGDESNHYVLTRKAAEPVNFANVIKVESADAFDGHYALTYLAGNGYTIKAANALEDLSTLGIKTTEVTIDSSLVELFGNDPRAYVFNEEDGSLNMEIQDNVDFLNIHIFKTETGIAINWLDLTFYAEPLQ